MPGTKKTATVADVVRQKIQIPYSYVAGPAVSRFLLGLKDKVFCASVCAGCGRKNVPPLSFCGRCWQPIERYEAAGPQGTLESFAGVPGGAGVYGLVRLDGANTLLAHMITAAAGDEIRCGVRVEPVWREERSGSILDLAGFRVLHRG